MPARIRFVSLLGGLTRNYAANPYDVMHRLAERTCAQAYVMPVPFFANSAEDREVLLEQRGVREVFEMAERRDAQVRRHRHRRPGRAAGLLRA